MEKKYSYLFFDLDKTFWDVDENQKCALAELFSLFKMDRNFESFNAFYDTFIEINTKLWLDYRDGLVQREELRNDRFTKLLAAAGVEDSTLALQMSDDYLRITPTYNNLMPYSKEILEYLYGKYPMGLITNGFNEVQFDKVKYAGIDRYFDCIVTSEFAGFNKPNPGIFEYALRTTGVEAKDAVMIGDDPYNDVYGASEVGMDTVYLNAEMAVHELSPTFEINSLIELKHIL